MAAILFITCGTIIIVSRVTPLAEDTQWDSNQLPTMRQCKGIPCTFAGPPLAITISTCRS